MYYKRYDIYLSIACAFIIAKVEHDNYIDKLLSDRSDLKILFTNNYGYGKKTILMQYQNMVYQIFMKIIQNKKINF